MTDKGHDLRYDDPEGGHDPDALEEGARRMGATKAGSGKEKHPDDPDGGHDPDALEDAAKKMHTDSD
jgi:hypothetical protein